MGITARQVIHRSHCTAEAWSDRWEKWVWLDFSGDMNDNTRAIFYMLRDGVPLSALEVHRAWMASDYRGMRLEGRHAPLRDHDQPVTCRDTSVHRGVQLRDAARRILLRTGDTRLDGDIDRLLEAVAGGTPTSR